ncbi:actin depolymerizing factor [Phaffia rhodozyma]|uniref:Cofilin n=1 Tax=Phaffia rhodozyma TaxID=264483 RepID=A0A0F7SWB3_PHARH|nr:actin depolymerizing factor [Phaffia rhodozyma]
MSSGASVNQECLSAYQELKAGKKIKYIVFGMSPDNTEIVVLSKSTEKSYDSFIEQLPENECRWAVYDFEFDSGEGIRNKLVFYMWTPDGAKIKPKMVYAASKDALRKSLVGIHTEIQGTDFDEVSEATVLEKVKRK